MKKIIIILVSFMLMLPAIIFAQGGEAAAPQKFSNTELHFLVNTGQINLNSDDPEEGRTFTLTLDHFSTWRYGSNYFFVDVTGEPEYDFYGDRATLYLEYAPALSLGKIFGLSFGDGVVKDVSVTGQINIAEFGRVWLEGAIVSWNVPGFLVFETSFLARQEADYKASWQVTWVWSSAFSIGPTGWEFRGFLDLWQRFRDRAGSEDALVMIAQPQILLNLGIAGLDELFIGLETQISYNFPVKGLYAGKDSHWDADFRPMILFRF